MQNDHTTGALGAEDDCTAHCPLAAAGTEYVVVGDVGGDAAGAIDRRAFLTRSMLAAAALALAACGGVGGDAPTAPASVSGSIKVSDYAALSSTGGVALVSVNGAPLAIVRTGTSSFVALSRICPHQGATVDATSGGFTCPRHGARFDSTGTWIGGQRTSNMRSYPTSYDAASGTLTIG